MKLTFTLRKALLQIQSNPIVTRNKSTEPVLRKLFDAGMIEAEEGETFASTLAFYLTDLGRSAIT